MSYLILVSTSLEFDKTIFNGGTLGSFLSSSLSFGTTSACTVLGLFLSLLLAFELDRGFVSLLSSKN